MSRQLAARKAPVRTDAAMAAALCTLFEAAEARVVDAPDGDGRRTLRIALDGGHAWLIRRRECEFTPDERAAGAALRPLLARTAWPTESTSATGETDWARLSRRERQVVDLLVTGCSAQRMGTVLGISRRTVDKHLQNAYDKLGVHDRLVLAVAHARVANSATVVPSAGAGHPMAHCAQ